MRLGTVIELWRYPVKSLGGERLEQAEIGLSGLAGDRHWALLDAENGEIRSAKRWPELMNYQARFSGPGSSGCEDYEAQVQPVEISAPDGQVLHSEEKDHDQKFSAWLGRPVILSRRRPAGDIKHYLLASARTEASSAAEMGLLAGEAPPDYQGISPKVMGALADCATPPGVYVDAFPLHLVSRNALRWLAQASGLDTDRQRFRPNLLVDIDGAGERRAEDDWVGTRIAIGETILRIDSRTVRCSMPARAQPLAGLAKQPTLIRTLVDHSQRRLGVNVIVERAGSIRAGDAILRFD